MLHINGLKKQYGEKVLFRNLDLHLRKNDRLALVGDNGSGKSTLMKMIMGIDYPDDGEIHITGNLKTGYLPQFIHQDFDESSILYDEVSGIFSDLFMKEERLRTLEEKMSIVDHESDEFDKIMTRYGNLQHELEEEGLYEIDSKIKTILFGLGFEEDDLKKRCNEFSGGWVMRIHLAKLLLSAPEILLLDEPTNHLDLEARNWLEDFIRSYKGAVILVSHDRFFLDATVNRVGELFATDFKIYKGNYSKFEKLRQEYIDNIYKSAKEYDEKVEKHTKFIEKFRYKATKASQVQSRIKMLDKIEKPIIPPKKKRISFTFPDSKESGLKVIEVKDLAKQYDENIVFMDVDFTVERGQRIAVCGKNGSGKTTLLKCIAGVAEKDMGEIEFGYFVKPNYYAQEPTELLSLENTLYDELYQNANFSQGESLRNLLGAFLFSNDDVYKKVRVLSGGERARLALAKMLLVPSNLLIMDEPTNHLDLESKDILLEALKKYKGTIIFVSHDRYFVENLANRVFHFQDNEMEIFNGNYTDFLKKVE